MLVFMLGLIDFAFVFHVLLGFGFWYWSFVFELWLWVFDLGFDVGLDCVSQFVYFRIRFGVQVSVLTWTRCFHFDVGVL